MGLNKLEIEKHLVEFEALKIQLKNILARYTGDWDFGGNNLTTTGTLTATTIGAFQAIGAIDFNNQNMTNVDIDSGTITGITDLAIADGGTGQSTADEAFDALSPLTTKGDIIVYNDTTGDAVRLPIGGDTQVLTADSAVADIGIKWAAGGGGGAPTDASYVTLGLDGDLSAERVLTGTANQVVVTDNGVNSTVVLSTPQSIATTSSVKFGQEEIEGTTDPLTILDQNNNAGAFIDFQGLSADNYDAPLSIKRGDGDVVGPRAVDMEDGWDFTRMIKIKINGSIVFIAVYSPCEACWVAKEIFGSWEHPKTKLARFYINHIGPKWFQKFYLKHGERIAEFISNKPLFKAILRPLFEIFALKGRREKCKKYISR